MQSFVVPQGLRNSKDRVLLSRSSRPATKQQRPVGATETERIRHGVFNFRLAGVVGNKIHSRSFRVLTFQVDGWRQYLIPKRQRGNSGLEPARTTEKMACH